jgi:hypothetical protein
MNSNFVFLSVGVILFVDSINFFNKEVDDMIDFVAYLLNFPVFFDLDGGLFKFRL